MVIGFSTGPWSIVKNSKKYYPDLTANTLFIPVDAQGSRTSSKYEREISITSLVDNFDDQDDLAGAIFLHLVIKALCDGWGIEVSTIVNSDWYRDDGSDIYRRVRKG